MQRHFVTLSHIVRPFSNICLYRHTCSLSNTWLVNVEVLDSLRTSFLSIRGVFFALSRLCRLLVFFYIWSPNTMTHKQKPIWHFICSDLPVKSNMPNNLVQREKQKKWSTESIVLLKADILLILYTQYFKRFNFELFNTYLPPIYCERTTHHEKYPI